MRNPLLSKQQLHIHSHHQLSPITNISNHRYLQLCLFFLIAISNSFPLQAFTGVSFIISDIYKQSILTVSINWIIYVVLYLVMILPANYIVDEKGLNFGDIGEGQTCMVVGLTLRCLINVSFTYFLFGTLMCSFGFCLTLSAANKLPSVWFPEQQILSVKSFLCLVLLLSDGLGFLISSLFITKDSSKSDVLKFFIIESSVLIIFQVVNMIFFKGNPTHSPNYFSIRSVKNFQQNIKRMVSNPTYWWLFLSLTFIFVCFSVLFVGLLQFERGFGTTQGLLKLRNLIVCFSGILGWYLNTLWCKNQYKLKCQILFLIIFTSYCLIWLGFESKQQWLIEFSMISLGVSVFPLIGLITDWAAQSIFPVGEGTSGGSLFFGGYTFGSISTLLFGIYIGHDDRIERSRITIIMFLVLIILSFLFMMAAEQKLKRKYYQQQQIIDQKLREIVIEQQQHHHALYT